MSVRLFLFHRQVHLCSIFESTYKPVPTFLIRSTTPPPPRRFILSRLGILWSGRSVSFISYAQCLSRCWSHSKCSKILDEWIHISLHFKKDISLWISFFTKERLLRAMSASRQTSSGSHSVQLLPKDPELTMLPNGSICFPASHSLWHHLTPTEPTFISMEISRCPILLSPGFHFGFNDLSLQQSCMIDKFRWNYHLWFAKAWTTWSTLSAPAPLNKFTNP